MIFTARKIQSKKNTRQFGQMSLAKRVFWLEFQLSKDLLKVIFKVKKFWIWNQQRLIFSDTLNSIRNALKQFKYAENFKISIVLFTGRSDREYFEDLQETFKNDIGEDFAILMAPDNYYKEYFDKPIRWEPSSTLFSPFSKPDIWRYSRANVLANNASSRLHFSLGKCDEIPTLPPTRGRCSDQSWLFRFFFYER